MMKVRHKKSGCLGHSNKFNIHSLNEIIVGFDDDENGEPMGADSDFIRNYEVFLEKTQQWKCMSQAFKDHDLITDNYNERFFEPKNDEERERGYR